MSPDHHGIPIGKTPVDLIPVIDLFSAGRKHSAGSNCFCEPVIHKMPVGNGDEGTVIIHNAEGGLP